MQNDEAFGRLYAIAYLILVVNVTNVTTDRLSEQQRNVNCSCPEKVSEFYFYECDKRNRSCFRCLNEPGAVISDDAVCDYKADCPDLSDEYLCPQVWNKSQDLRNKSDQCYSSFRIPNRGNRITCNEDDTDNSRKDQNGNYWRNTYYENEKCNDYRTCENGKDECEENCTHKNSLADSKEMIKPYFHSMVYAGLTIGIGALLGNTAVILNSIVNLRKKHKSLSPPQIVTKTLFLSLSISDILVTIYIIILCSASLYYGIEFCKKRKGMWLKYCDGLGSMVLIGSEQSVFTMVLISLSRVWGVVKPFKTIRAKAIILPLLFSWCLSVLIAIVPRMENFEDTFVHVIFHHTGPLLRRVEFDKIDCYLSFIERNTNAGENTWHHSQWAKLKYLMKKNFNINDIKSVGYYTGRTSCLPNIIPNDDVQAWWYSMMILIINFICFIIMLACYMAIYRSRTNVEQALSRDNGRTKSLSTRLKRRIFLILATDFLCWIPICIIGVVEYIKDKNIDGDQGDNSALIAALTLILLPINSLLNPIIYSFPMHTIKQKMTTYLRRKRQPKIPNDSKALNLRQRMSNKQL